MDPGWHLYSLTTPEGGPLPTRVSMRKTLDKRVPRVRPSTHKIFDKNFNLDVETYDKQADFLLSAS
jgi:thiol:disulfide interchange protein DsbD